MELKKCSKCNILKPSNTKYYHKDSTRNDNLHGRCKLCVKKIREIKWAETKINEINHRSGSIKYDVEIDSNYLYYLYKKQNGKCYWSGLEMDTTRKNKLTAISVDRLDNNKGYLIGNVVLSLRFCNIGRGNVDAVDFKEFIINFKKTTR